MKQTVIYEVSEILDFFNLQEITKLLTSQIQIDSSSSIITQTSDHFKPLYYKYQSIMNTESNSDEIKEETEKKFMDICNIFLNLICNKYGIDIDETWKDDHYADIPALTMALYSFFVLDLPSNMYDVCVNYIKKNSDAIYEVFEERKSKKDAFTLVNKKILSPNMAIIISNIYDVTTWILSQLSEEQFVDYINQDYLPLKLISELLTDGILSGEFMTEINDIYSTNISLRGDICFKIMTLAENGKM